MVLAFTGDGFLAREALHQEAQLQGLTGRLLPPEPAVVVQEASGGLFGPAGACVDLREVNEGEWKELRAALEKLPTGALVLLLDPKPTAARSKWYGKERQRDFPAPKGRELARWLENRSKALNLKLGAAICQYMADLVGGRGSAENPALGLEALDQELDKIALITPPINLEKVQALLAIEAPIDGFALVRSVTEGKSKEAFKQTRHLLDRGEDPLRVLGALSWQYGKLARAWGYLQQNPLLGEGDLASLLSMHPFAARQTLALAKQSDLQFIEAALEVLMQAELRAKSGQDIALALEGAVAGLIAVRFS